jgi:hypothetical protein
MGELRALEEPQQVVLAFTYDVEQDWIDKTVDEEGLRPASRWEVTFDLSEVSSPELRKRLRLAHVYYEESPAYPVLPAPTEKPDEFANGFEAWRAAVDEENAASTAHSQAESESQELQNKAFEEDKATWVASHGSERLKLAVERGYKANRTYALERAGSEFPDFWVDTAEDMEWNERVDPSKEALDIEIQTRGTIETLGLDDGADTRIVWLTEAPRGVDKKLDESGEQFEPQEAVVVTPYLRRYSLALPVDPDARVEVEEEA